MKRVQHPMGFFLILIFCGFFAEVCRSQGFSVIGPKVIRPGSNYTVALSNPLRSNVRLQVELGNETQTIDQLQALVPTRRARAATFYIGDIPNGNYWLSIKSLHDDFTFSQRVELEYGAKTMSVFIQTDKPVYKPDDRIRFRVVVVDVNTRPVKSIETISIALTDGEGESVRQWPYARLHNGIFESAVQLASAQRLGKWTLTVTTKEGAKVNHFEVKEYVLPKFYVEAAPSKVLLASSKEISVAVKCYYTFGEPVDGIVTVDLFLEENFGRPNFSVTKPIPGSTTVDFKLREEIEIDGDAKFASVIAKVKVLESFTGHTHNITQLIPIYQNPYDVTLLPSSPAFRPGVEFPVTISVRDHFGQLPRELGAVNMTVRIEGTAIEDEISYENNLDVQGTASFMLSPPAGAHLITFSVIYNSVEYDTEPKEIRGYQSESNQYIKVTLNPKYKVKVNKEVVFDVSCTEPMSHFSYVVVARGSIIATSNIPVANKKRYSFRYKMLPEMSPEARIVVFYTNEKYLIFDDLVLCFDEFNNDFKFRLDEEQYRSGQDVYIEVHAAKDSYIAFQAIDQSVLLVAEDNNGFTRKDVLKDLSLYGSTSSIAFDHFHTIGLFLKSTVVVDAPAARDQLNRFGAQRINLLWGINIRTVFPESWLWVNYTMNKKSTKLEFNDTVPDSTTSWYVSGFALSPTLGLGVISQPLKFEVRKSFFLVANLPYSIRQGEVALIQVTVFNFVGNTLTSYVTLHNIAEEIEFVDKSCDSTLRRTKAVVVPTNNGKPISFMIKAKQLGEISIRVEADSMLCSDAIDHVLRVTPDNHRSEKNEARFFYLDFHQTVVSEISLDIPGTIDEGSVQIKFSLDSDILGLTIDNLENLIRLPTGCGEQNMINLVPSIVILDYMSETGNVPEAFKTKAINHLRNGYQNQLKYKRSDGSFSVWGPEDTQSSTFITALVAKSLKKAVKYIEVDNQISEKAFEWLASIQNDDGSFYEVGRIINKNMQGGQNSTSYALTSYVLTAFTENEDIAKQYEDVVNKTMNFLANNFWNISDPYDLALASYGMALGKHVERNKFFDKLMEASILDNATIVRYWNRSPVDVEVAGYALLTLIANGQYAEANPIMRWLIQQRNDRGGFSGTQDSFVGLAATSSFAAKLSAHSNDYRVTVMTNSNRTFFVDETNSMNIQERNIPDHVRHLQVKISGIGHGVFQVAYQYNLNMELEEAGFKLQVDVLKETTYHVQHLKVCVAYIPDEAYQRSNMALVEVFFPSGMVAESNAVKDLSSLKLIRKTELRSAPTSIVVYYDNLGPEEVCFEVTAFQKYKVAQQLPAYVKVYDYYNRDRFAIKRYQGKVTQICDIWDDDDGCETVSY